MVQLYFTNLNIEIQNSGPGLLTVQGGVGTLATSSHLKFTKSDLLDRTFMAINHSKAERRINLAKHGSLNSSCNVFRNVFSR